MNREKYRYTITYTSHITSDRIQPINGCYPTTRVTLTASFLDDALKQFETLSRHMEETAEITDLSMRVKTLHFR